MRAWRTSLILALGLELGPAHAAEPLRWPDLPIEVRFEEVLENAVISGIPARVRRFHSSQPPHEVLMKIESAWRTRGGPPPRRLRQGPWEIISAWGPSQVSNVQVRAGTHGGTEGLLSVWSADLQPLAEESLRGLLPEGARILRVLTSGEAPRIARSVVAMVDADPRSVRTQSTDRLRAAGFRSLMPPGPNDSGSSPSAALFRDASRELLLTVMPMGTQTGLVMHLRSEAP